MDDHWTVVILTIFPNISEVEAFWQEEVQLNGGHGFFQTNGSLELDVQFRTVEGCFPDGLEVV